MIQASLKPFLPMHETILAALSAPNTVFVCVDPAQEWTPYVGAMLDAGWLRVEENMGEARFRITEAGRQRLELQRLGEEPEAA